MTAINPMTNSAMQATQIFGTALTNALAATNIGPNTNIIVSPLNVHHAMAITLGGARGDTLVEMWQGLGFEGTPNKANRNSLVREYGSALRKLTDRASTMKDVEDEDDEWMKEIRRAEMLETARLHTAANLYTGPAAAKFDPEYVRLVRESFGVDVESVQIGDEDKINRWVTEQTESEIRDLIPPDTINHLTASIVVSAMYFYAMWNNPFKEEMNRDWEFKKTDGRTTVTMMQQTGGFHYLENDGVQTVRLPYKDKNFGMIFMLPNGNPMTFQGFIERYGDGLYERARSVVSESNLQPIELGIPKFSAAVRFDNMSGILASNGIGIKRAFDQRTADFGDMFSEGKGDNVFLDRVIHAARINVNELGTEATAGGMASMSLGISDDPPINFTIDKPAFWLLHGPEGVPLFSGWLASPPAPETNDRA